MLRAFVLARDHKSCGDVCDSDRGVCGVDVLSTCAGCAEGVDAQVVGVDVHFHVIGFGQDGDGGGGGVHATLGFGGGDALYAVGAGLPFELGVDTVTSDHEIGRASCRERV